MPYTAAQKKAFAARMAKARAEKKYVRGSGAYRASSYKPKVYKRKYVKGRGDYKTSAGYKIGKEIGGVLGYGTQKLAQLMGFGDYHVQANSIMGGVYNPPELHNKSDRTVVIRHREFITDINATSAFTVRNYSINPGLVSSFPWFNQVSSAFEEYRFTGIVFEYKSLSADYTSAASAALGYVLMATNYNVLNSDFADKATMENYEFSTSGKPSDCFLHPVECKRSLNPISELYVRTGTPTSGDLRLYDHGNFQIATGGNAGTGTIGELWCTFECELYKTKSRGIVGSQLLTDHWVSTNATNAAPFGVTQTLQPGSNGGTVVTTRSITFPPNIHNGSWLVTYANVGTSAATSLPSLTYADCAASTVFNNDTAGYLSTSGFSAGLFMFETVIDITGPGAIYQWGTNGVFPSSSTAVDLWITQINGDILT